jgi:hypothetical protein
VLALEEVRPQHQGNAQQRRVEVSKHR